MPATAQETSPVRTRPSTAWWRWAVVLLPAVALFVVTIPGLNAMQCRLLGVFLATIIALVAQPVAMGVTMFLALTVLALTRTLPPAKLFSGFGNVTVWLIFAAFLFARAVTVTGFGARIGYIFIKLFARTPLTLGYSLAAADAVLAPFIPSDTARGGGIVCPMARSVAQAFGSEPGGTARHMGSFLMLVAFHATYTASAMFLTGMAANPVMADFALKIAHVDLTWMRWFLAAIVPGTLTLLVMPYLIYRLDPPELRDVHPARELARKELARMGPMSRNERWLLAIMLGVMAGWVTSPWHGISNTFVALTGVTCILLAKVLTWEDLLGERKAWDALVWFASLLMMSDALNEAGVIKFFSDGLFHSMRGWSWGMVLVGLVVAYLYIHYSFASMTAHIMALYPGFLGAALAGGVPPLLAALPLAFFSNLNAGLTHYGTGSAPVYFGAGYVGQGTWWKLGFLLSVVNLAIWMGIGIFWWKLIGLW
ncbi:MAG TPA: DASS family sodium-coupled anion symporter [Bryobacteraceae bacterium]|nr:DASS family sodium-coupled anion symporter [Bryobacteraceae bacterium]